MKKIVIALLAIVMLCGCSANNSTALVSGSDEVIFSGPGMTYTKADLNASIKGADYTSVIMPEIIKMMAESEGVDVTAIENEASEYIDDLVAQGMESYIAYYYGSVELFKTSYVANEIITNFMTEKVNAEFDSYVSEYLPYKAEIVYFDSTDACEDVVKRIADGETFAYASSTNGYTKEVTTTVYSDKDDQPIEVKEALLAAETAGILGPIEVVTYAKDNDGNEQSISRYYMVNLISKNVEDFRDEFVEKVLADIDSEALISQKLAAHDVRTYDQRTYELLKASYEAIK